MDLKTALNEINQIPAFPKWKPTLDKITKAINELFSDLDSYKDNIWIIAGTNGKGSIVKTLESFFLSDGQDVLVYTSPHLIKINERISVNGHWISDEDFLKTYQAIRPTCKKYDLSHFEILTLLALYHFYPKLQKGAKALFEVGMGGRWDATNAIPHKNVVLCPIGLDHQKFLGSSLEEIAQNKFDVIQNDNCVYSVTYDQSLMDILNKKISKTHSKLYLLDSLFKSDFKLSIDSENLTYQLNYKGLKYPLKLAGKRGFDNSLFALFIWSHIFKQPWQKALEHLKYVEWPHRFSAKYSPYFEEDVFYSGDHNPAGMQSLIEILNDFPHKKWWVLCAITEGRDPDQMFSPLFQQENLQLVLCQSPFRNQTLEEYKKWQHWEEGKVYYNEKIEDCLKYIKDNKKKDESLLVTGSLYLTGFVEDSIS